MWPHQRVKWVPTVAQLDMWVLVGPRRGPLRPPHCAVSARSHAHHLGQELQGLFELLLAHHLKTEDRTIFMSTLWNSMEKTQSNGFFFLFLPSFSFCEQGEQCKFDHDAELEKRKEICKFYLQGYCTKGENCIYMHNILYWK